MFDDDVWAKMGPVEQARAWEEFKPGSFDKIFNHVMNMAESERSLMEINAKHERRLDYILVGIQALTTVAALGAVIALCLTAAYFAQHGDATQGVKIFGVIGAGSVVGAFFGINSSPAMKRLKARSYSRRRRSLEIPKAPSVRPSSSPPGQSVR